MTAAATDRRIGLLFLAFLVLLVVALARAAYLGSVRAGALQHLADIQQVTTVPLPAERGLITDASGNVLALSEAADDVIADPNLTTSPMKDARTLSPIIGVPVLTLDAELTRRTGYAVLAKRVPVATARRAQSAIADPLSLTPDDKRVYPRSWTASQVLGWTAGWDGQGTTGIEYQYNSQLQGRNGARKVIDDAKGQAIDVQNLRATRAGKAIGLTLNAPLQDEVEQVLAGIGAQYSPKLATAIVVDPQTGAILALANWPRVNANDPYAGPSSAAVNNAIQDHAVSFTYEPGSTFKAVTVAGALQDGLITPSTVFDVPPDLQAYGSTITDAESHGYENLTTADILKVSSNIGADLIGHDLGPTRFNHWVHQFGFGAPTGVDLPGEDNGYILSPSKYSGTSMLNLPFGQGESVTPMQMATAYTAIADGGILRPLHVVQSIGGKAVKTSPGHRIISAGVAGELRTMLQGVYADGGTASGAAIPGYNMAGKTGTANIAIGGKYSNTEYVASFVGMVPANHPQLLGLVVVDEPQGSIYGGSVAAPAFQKIVGWAVPYLGINPR
ncbi:MAG TPA: penicillin-binding protein 2 [Solirubrobacteraceae bacterium]|nr:penicillin-binding protein 2 [Solirubrobacteraceae bacterium]